MRATEPKLLHYTFTFLAYQIQRLYHFCRAVEKARSCLGTHHRGICIEHAAVCCSWSLEIQVVDALLPVEALTHLFFFFAFNFLRRRFHQLLDEIGVFELNYYAFG